MSNLTIFKNEDFGDVRTTLVDNQPYFCLADVCRILDIKNARDCRKRLKDKGVASTDTLTKGGLQAMIFVDESNLYRCIFQSRKSEAEKFQDWVTEEVLPQIRKTGGYLCIPKRYPEVLRLYADEGAWPHRTIRGRECIKFTAVLSRNVKIAFPSRF